ncbi:MAG: glycerol-3-phosphate cytidylyltransferase [Deltaproteobacteria bacterium GWA2_55_10]|nr:MAG: glycerol-3-phosphate cytidylyltransferase [Deltaproteobacteria bacterium GWA2_55_10]
MGKVITLRSLLKELPKTRRGRKVVFTNGCFDILHAGHVRYLKKARSLGGMLIVGMNSDSSVKSIKGDRRPIVPGKERGEVLSALACVDYVVPFNESTPLKLIEAIRPDILAKGADWAARDIVGGEFVKRNGGRVARITLLKGRSTTNIIRRVIELHADTKRNQR